MIVAGLVALAVGWGSWTLSNAFEAQRRLVGNVFTGDLGVSFRDNEPVTTTLLQRLPATIALALSAIVVVALLDIVDFGKITTYALKTRREFMVFAASAALVVLLGAVAGIERENEECRERLQASLEAAYQTGAQIRQDVAEQVGGDHDVEALRVHH